MDITSEQRKKWGDNPETAKFEAFIGPVYKDIDGSVHIDRLFAFAEKNGFYDLREKYAGLNEGQIAMNIRNQLRPLWRADKLKNV